MYFIQAFSLYRPTSQQPEPFQTAQLREAPPQKKKPNKKTKQKTANLTQTCEPTS